MGLNLVITKSTKSTESAEPKSHGCVSHGVDGYTNAVPKPVAIAKATIQTKASVKRRHGRGQGDDQKKAEELLHVGWLAG